MTVAAHHHLVAQEELFININIIIHWDLDWDWHEKSWFEEDGEGEINVEIYLVIFPQGEKWSNSNTT